MDKYEEFEARMLKDYPTLFSQRFIGFAIGEGWYHIIENLCKQIHSHISWQNECAARYPDKNQPCPNVSIVQIKEKFGDLRFYYDGGDDTISGMVSMAEAWSKHTCETCGNLGQRRSGGWIRTLCDKHEEEYQSRKNKE